MKTVAVSAFAVLLLVFPAHAQKPELVVGTSHTDQIHSVAFSPDGRTVASGSWDKTVKLWDVASGREFRTLTGHTNRVTSVAFSPDGRTLASGSYDKTVKLWDVASGRELRALAGHTDIVWSVAFSPDGRTVASGSDDNTVRLWDMEKREVPGDQVRAIERLKDRTGLYVLMGAAADRPSYEASQFGQGLLTYALLKGMKGAALRDGEYVDVAKLFQEASDDVPELAKNIGGIQQPRIATPGGASFDIGKLIAEDRQEIPLATIKPLLLRPLFLNAQMHRDTLGVSAALRKRLQEESFAPVGRGGSEPTTVYIDEDDFPGAISPSGDYTITDKRVEVTVVLSKDGKDVAQFKVEGSTDDLPGLTNKLAEAIDKALPK